MKFRVKSQLDHIERGGILDDCGPSSAAAAVSWAAGYAVDFSAADGIAAKAKATGKLDRQGVADNGSSLSDLAKTAKVLGATARYPKSWDDIVQSAKRGAGLIIWVEQAVSYPPVEISAWHRRYEKRHPGEHYGHMTAAGWCADHGWWWTCPTRSGKGAEAFGVLVDETQLRKIADSKRASRKHIAPEFKHVLIVEHAARKDAAAKTPEAPAAPAVRELKTSAAAPTAKTEAKPTQLDVAMQSLKRVDLNQLGGRAIGAAKGAAAAAANAKGLEPKMLAALRWIRNNTGIDEALLEAARVFIATCIAMMLATGAPLLDMQAGDFKIVISGGLAAALNVVVRFLNPNDTQFGVQKK